MASADDTDGDIVKVEFFANGAKLGEDVEAPYSLTWSSPPEGNYRLTAVATDNDGATAVSPTLPIVVELPPEDTDQDGVPDAADNCVNVSHPSQRDTDGDGYGNICDADLNNDGDVGFADLDIFRSRFATSDPDADFDGSGSVSFADLDIFRRLFNAPPGPAGGL